MTNDLVERQLHSLLIKKAAIPRSAMPWMNKVTKDRGTMKGFMPPTSAKDTVMPNRVLPKIPEAPPLSLNSIKSMGRMGPGGQLIHTKYKRMAT